MRAHIWPLFQDPFHQHHSKITPLKRIKRYLKICLLTRPSNVALQQNYLKLIVWSGLLFNIKPETKVSVKQMF